MVVENDPGKDAHCRLQDHFRAMVANLFNRARKMSPDEISDEVKYLINGWFYNHIITVDVEYAPNVLPRHGLQAGTRSDEPNQTNEG